MTLTVTKNGVPLYDQAPIPTGSGDWQEVELPLEWDSSEQIQEMERESIGVDEPSQEIRGVPVRGDKPGGAGSQPDGPVSRPIVRWPGEGSLTIEKIALLGMNGSEQCVFPVGSPMILTMAVLAHTTGNFHFISAASLYRLDGIFISNFVGHAIPLEFTEGQVREFQLIIPAINLGDGSYVFSLSIFEGIIADESRYDLIDRAYEFKVVGNPPLVANTVFQHSGDWRQL
jgi:hypothetical protein